MKDFFLRFAKTEDAPQIALLEKNFFSDPWTQRQVEEEIICENAVFVVCEASAGQIAGYVSGRNNSGDFYINNIAVAENYRRRGIGEALLNFIIAEAKKNECSFVTLEVRQSNFPAIYLYEKCGFVLAGRRKSFYRAPEEDALLYTVNF